MRKVAIVENNLEVKRVMLCDSDCGCYVFLYDQLADGSGTADYLFESVEDAVMSCSEDYGVREVDWIPIPDAQDGCQDDWIEPVRVVGRNIGRPQWGHLERFEAGRWIPIK